VATRSIPVMRHAAQSKRRDEAAANPVKSPRPAGLSGMSDPLSPAAGKSGPPSSTSTCQIAARYAEELWRRLRNGA
jgi:hypothetical protein